MTNYYSNESDLFIGERMGNNIFLTYYKIFLNKWLNLVNQSNDLRPGLGRANVKTTSFLSQNNFQMLFFFTTTCQHTPLAIHNTGLF